MLHISKEEYRQRVSKLHDSVVAAELDTFVVSSFDSIYYLTGVGFEPLERPFFLLIHRDGSPALLVPKLDQRHMELARLSIPDLDVHSYREYPAPEGEGWCDRLRELLGGRRAVGVEPSLSLEIAGKLHDYSPRPMTLIEELRLVKSPTELDMIRRAARYADLGVKRLLAASYDGAIVAEGFAETRTVTGRIIREVVDWQPLTTRVLMATWPAPRSAKPHSIPGLREQLVKGPHTALVLTRVNGYAAESERTYFTQAPSKTERHAFAAMLHARNVALQMVRPGVPCADIDGKVNDFLEAEYPASTTRLHRTGHGIGLGNHEAPWLAAGSTDVLKENMVVSIEPGIYLSENGGFRHSDTVLVTATGYELLTRLPLDIDTLTIRSWKPIARLKGWWIRSRLAVSRKVGATQ